MDNLDKKECRWMYEEMIGKDETTMKAEWSNAEKGEKKEEEKECKVLKGSTLVSERNVWH